MEFYKQLPTYNLPTTIILVFGDNGDLKKKKSDLEPNQAREHETWNTTW